MLIASRYKLREQIGQGGMGTVYHGLDTQTDQPVAIKLLRPGIITNEPILVARFSREGEMLRQLDHPGIVKMLETAELDGQTCIVMEYVGGGNLSHYLQHHGPLPIERVTGIGLEVADALTRAHHLNIIHRDLKPDNVLVAEDGTPRLTDFGLARMRGQAPLTQSDTVIGTLHYLSPEALHGEELDERADIWSFGVMLYEMLTGIRPFEGQGLSAVLAAIIMQPPTPDLETLRADVPVALVDLIYRMLEKDRLRRIPSVRLVGAELEAIKRGTDLSKPAWQPLHDDSTSLFATPTQPTDAIGLNLPVQLTAFVGREAELTEMDRLLDDPNVRLVTILAPGGMGKTRLSLEAASNQLGAFSNGVYFVPLAQVQTTDGLTTTIAECVQYQFHQGVEPKQQLLDFFQTKQMLIVLDNFEHLLDSVELVTDILRVAQQVKIIITSRERLNIQSETLFRIRGMDVAHWETLEEAREYAVVTLFVQSARQSRPDFELQGEDLKHLERICRLVEGMPLGILLSAAWVDHLVLDEIAGEISQSLDILETDLRDVPSRHQSIRAAIEPTWKRLSPKQQAVFTRLSVFRGGFARESAQEVAGAGLRDLTVLANKAMLHRDPASGRYAIHELLRQYAEEKLEEMGAADSVRENHNKFYMCLLQHREADLKGHGQVKALEQIDVEFANIQVAWLFAVDKSLVDRIDRSLESLALYCTIRGYDAGLLERAQIRVAPAKGMRRDPLWGRISARLLSKQRAQVKEALVIAREYGDQPDIGRCLLELAEYSWRDDRDYANALVLLEESLSLFEKLDDRYNMANALQSIGFVHSYAARHDLTTEFFEKSFSIRREIGDRYGLAQGLCFRLLTLLLSRDFANIEPLSQEALRLLPLFGKSEGLLMVHAAFGMRAFIDEGDLEGCWHNAQEMRRLFVDTNYYRWDAMALGFMSCITAMEGNYLRAEKLIQEAQMQLDKVTIYQPGIQSLIHLTSAIIAAGTRNYLHLKRSAADALQFPVGIRSPAWMEFYLPVIPPLFMHEGKKEKAAELMGFIFSQPIGKSGWASKWKLLAEIRSRLEAELVSDIYKAASDRGESLDLQTTTIEIARQLKSDS